MGEKNVRFNVSATDDASGVFGNIGSAIGNVATVAGGIVVAQVFDKIASGIGAFVSSGISAVGAAQELEASLKALLTSNNMYAKTTEQLTIANSLSADEMAKNNQKATDLKMTNQVLAGQIQEQKQRIIELTAAYGDNGLNVQTARAELEKMEYTLGKNQSQIDKLSSAGTTYSTVSKTTTKKVMEQKDAMLLAAKQTAELTDFISKLAVVSPFETQSVEQVSKYAIAAGLGVDETKNFATGFLDLAAAVGIGSENLGFAADQLLQVSKVGKLTEIDLRQLRRMGIDVGKVLEVEMGMSVDEFNKKAENTPEIFNELFNAVSRFSKNTFAGTSKAMATSIKGIGATMNDIFVIGGRELFRPLVDAVSPMMSEIVGKMANMVLGGDMAKIGERIAEAIAGPLSKAKAIANAFGRSFDEGFRMIGYFAAKAWPDIQAALGNLLSGIGSFLMGQWNSLVMPTLTGWATSFFAWIPQAIANLPTTLNELLAGLNAYLSGETPALTESMSGWSTSFWGWTKTALAGVSEAMGILLAAMVTWAMSPEASTQLLALGQNIGLALKSALQVVMQNTDQWSPVLTQIVAGLAVAAAAVTASLAVVGGTILAGIFSGLGEQITGYRPWTIGQFQQFADWVAGIDWRAVGTGLMFQIQEGLASTWESISEAFRKGVKAWGEIFTKAKWTEIGWGIIAGILKGIKEKQGEFLEYIKQIAWDTISGFANVWQTHSPSKVFADMGTNLIMGLVQGTEQSAPQFTASLGKMFGVVTSEAEEFQQAFDRALNFRSILTDKYHLTTGHAQDLTNMVRSRLVEVLPQVEKGTFGAGDFAKLVMDTAEKMTPGAASRIMAEGTDVLTNSWTYFAEAFKKTSGSFEAGNINKISSGISQVASTAQQSFTELQQRIATIQTLLRRGVGQISIAGQIMDAAQAQQYLNGLVAQQVGMTENLASIQGSQQQMETLQGYLKALNMVGSLPANTATVLEQSARAMQLLGDQITPQLSAGAGGNMSALLQLLSGGRGGRQTTNNITLVVNSDASESSVLQDFSLLQSLIPSGT